MGVSPTTGWFMQPIEQDMRPESCLTYGIANPCSIVIFGATGDLTTRKLAPALYNLYLQGVLPESSLIVGVARSEMSDDQFRMRIKEAVAGKDMSMWEKFAAALYYHSTQFDHSDSLSQLSEKLKNLEKERNLGGDRIFYLAIPPSLYDVTVEMIGRSGLSRENFDGNGWARIVIEKPFGRDLKTAIELNKTLQKHFDESRIFRIDHYLAKETVQNVLMLRFANTIFEPLWNRMFVDHVQITAAESIGIENRAKYYEDSGILRDMFQNHMMQLLALTAMEPPSELQADYVRDERCKIFRSLRPFSAEDDFRNIILGQYGPGTVDGLRVRGYREEPGVSPASMTPTFAMMKVFVENWRWNGVPFYLTSGKRLGKKLTEIVIHFRTVPHSMFRNALQESVTPNILTLGIYPDETVNLTFQINSPGSKICLRSVAMDFNYNEVYSLSNLDAYERLLLDCIQGDQMLFWRQDAVELCWSFLEPVLNHCESCLDMDKRLLTYDAGTWGPEIEQL